MNRVKFLNSHVFRTGVSGASLFGHKLLWSCEGRVFKKISLTKFEEVINPVYGKSAFKTISQFMTQLIVKVR